MSYKCTNTWLGILCSNTPFPHNVFDIGCISRFSALMAIDLEGIGVFRPEIYDLDPGKSRGRFDFMQALVAIFLVCQNFATKLVVLWRWNWFS